MFTEKFKGTLEAYERFWNREALGRPTLNITYKKEGYVPYRKPVSLEEKWLDENYIYDEYKHRINGSGFVAEGIPMLFTNLGPGCLAACIGGGYMLMDRTVYFDQKAIIEDWDAAPELKFDEKSDLWQAICRIQNKFAADPDTHFSITDIGGVMDILSSLRGATDLLCDLYDEPEKVREYAIRIREIWDEVFKRQVEFVRKSGQPFNNWMNIPSAKPWYPIQCDFCYMISPDHFDEFVLPDIIYQAKRVGRAVYHLDGVGELPHLDKILDIPEICAIQWRPGAGEAAEWDEKWYDIYKKIQDKKKNLILLSGVSETDMEGAERLIKSIDPTGVYLKTFCSSQKTAEELYENVLKWS